MWYVGLTNKNDNVSLPIDAREKLCGALEPRKIL